MKLENVNANDFAPFIIPILRQVSFPHSAISMWETAEGFKIHHWGYELRFDLDTLFEAQRDLRTEEYGYEPSVTIFATSSSTRTKLVGQYYDQLFECEWNRADFGDL